MDKAKAEAEAKDEAADHSHMRKLLKMRMRRGNVVAKVLLFFPDFLLYFF